MTSVGNDSLKTRRTLTVNGKDYDYFSLPAAAEAMSRFPLLHTACSDVSRASIGPPWQAVN